MLFCPCCKGIQSIVEQFSKNSGELWRYGDRPVAGEVMLVPSFAQRIDVGYFHFVLKCAALKR